MQETWVRMIPWRREPLPTLVFFPGEFHGPYSPWDHVTKSRTWLSDFHKLILSTFSCVCWPSVCILHVLFGKNVYSDSLAIFYGWILIFAIEFYEFLIYFDINPYQINSLQKSQSSHKGIFVWGQLPNYCYRVGGPPLPPLWGFHGGLTFRFSISRIWRWEGGDVCLLDPVTILFAHALHPELRGSQSGLLSSYTLHQRGFSKIRAIWVIARSSESFSGSHKRQDETHF